MTAIAIEQPSETDIDAVHSVLTETYWSLGIPRDVVARACANSICAIARDAGGAPIGFTRVVSDRATFAWLCDVYVLPAHQSQGIARSLVAALQAHPDLQGLRRWMLGTRDAHDLYAPRGFKAIDEPHRLMQIRDLNPYGRPAI